MTLNETFEGVTPPAVPSSWVKDGNGGTYNLGGAWGNVLYNDLAYPAYTNNANTTLTSPTYNLSTGGANIDFWVQCDTEYSLTNWTDYMALEYSADGVNFLETDSIFGEGKIDEPLLDLLNGNSDPSLGATYHFQNQYSKSIFHQ